MLKLEDIKQHDDGIFFVRKYLGMNAITGEPLRPYKRFPKAKTPEEAFAMAQEWYNTIAAATDLHVSQRLDELLSRYIDHLCIQNVSPNTTKTYRSALDCYVAPYLGAKDPDRLRPFEFEGLYNVLLLKGARHGEGIAASTVLKTHWFLRGAFNWFVIQGVCSTNPLVAVNKPSPDIVEAVAYNEAEYNMLQAAIMEIIHAPAESKEAILRRNCIFGAHLALNIGEREGEVCANWRDDANLQRQFMHICANAVEETGVGCYRRPKTKGKKSRNASMDGGLCQDIRDHYEWQKTYLPRSKQRSGKTFICTTADGEIIRPSVMSDVFSELVEELGLPEGTSFHTLRHTHATWLLLDGMDMREIQERLGHYDVSLTLRTYSHIMPGRDRAAAQSVAQRRARIEDQL